MCAEVVEIGQKVRHNDDVLETKARVRSEQAAGA